MFYAVARGKKTGIFSSWAECQAQTNGFKNPKFKKFPTHEEAQAFLDENSDKIQTSESIAAQVMDLRSGLEEMKRKFEQTFADLYQKTDQILLAVNGNNDILLPPKPKKIKTGQNSSGFKVDNEGFVIVYTDGACSNNGKANPKAGCGVFWDNGHPLNQAFPASRATNNCGEIEACTKAIQIATQENIQKLVIRTDSQFTMNCVQKWMANWKKKGWKTAEGNPVKNEVELKELDEAMKADPKLKVKWEKVAAHNGIHGNEMADELARQGAKEF